MKRNFRYVLNKREPTKSHTKTGEDIPNHKRVSANQTTFAPGRSRADICRIKYNRAIDKLNQLRVSDYFDVVK